MTFLLRYPLTTEVRLSETKKVLFISDMQMVEAVLLVWTFCLKITGRKAMNYPDILKALEDIKIELEQIRIDMVKFAHDPERIRTLAARLKRLL